jgi:hypothetical protein
VLPTIRSVESFVAGERSDLDGERSDLEGERSDLDGERSDLDGEEGRPPMGSAVEARPLFVIATVKETSSSATPRPVSMPSPRPAHSCGRGAMDMV